MQDEALTIIDADPEPASLALVTKPGVIALAKLSYDGAGSLTLDAKQSATLVAAFPDEAYEVKPTGEVYVSQVHYRRRLNEVFGPGAWALVPRTGYMNQNDTVCREYALYVRGVFVSEAIGETDYQPTNDRMSYASAAEGAKSSALTRCCKDLGIASECWSRRWANEWRAKHCVQVWRSGTSKPQWRLADADAFHDEKGPVVPKAPGEQSQLRATEATPRAPELAAAPCPQCGAPARASKYPKGGKTHVCGTCKEQGNAGAQVAFMFAPKAKVGA